MDRTALAAPPTQKSDALVQCHFISNTHWDREWRYSAQRTRFLLVEMLDMLFDIFEKEPEFRSFHLDSQTLPLQDYLEIRPEMEERIRKYVQEGKLVVGPWFCLPDEFCVGGESLVRNLLLGHRLARRFGDPAKTGYSPFSWGQISQMPQIYKGFGIDVAAFYRGINALVAPRSEFYWESPDGSRVIGSRLGLRPRYNVWYVIHRRVFFGMEDCNRRRLDWGEGGAPFQIVSGSMDELDSQFAHPDFRYDHRHLKAAVLQAIEEQNPDWSTPHRFWSEGHDSSSPDIREVQMIKDCNEVLGEAGSVFHSTVAEWQEGLRNSQSPDWPVVRGEMRYLKDKKARGSDLYGWIISARTYLKQANFRAERDLQIYAEPLSVCASLLGAPYPGAFIDQAYNWLLQNHGHDSIGGCSRDVVHDDMMCRYRQVRELASCLTEKALSRIAGAIDLSDGNPLDLMVVAFNPTAEARTQTVPLRLTLPSQIEFRDLELVTEEGESADSVLLETQPHIQIVQNPNDCANTFVGKRASLLATLRDVPPMGYKTYRVLPRKAPPRHNNATLRTGVHTMANEFLQVDIQENGALTLLDRMAGRTFRNLGVFVDDGECGNPWERKPPVHDVLFTTQNHRPEIVLVRDCKLETAFEVRFRWTLPESRSPDERTRSHCTRDISIVNTITLRKDLPWVEIVTAVDNTVEDHRLRVLFPTGIRTNTVHVQTPFDVVARSILRPDPSLYMEPYQSEFPMNSFVDLSDGESGLAILNEGLKAYEAMDDPERTLALTLIRAFPLRICVTPESMTDYSRSDHGSQCPGRQVFRYSLMPHRGNWEEGCVWSAAEAHNNDLLACQIAPHEFGHLPKSGTFLEIDPPLHLSALKRSESGAGWVVRLFNPSEKAVAARVRFNRGYAAPVQCLSPVQSQQARHKLPGAAKTPWNAVRTVTLEEIPLEPLSQTEDGFVPFNAGGKQIVTLEFLDR